MSIKRIFGFCECKGCRQRIAVDVRINAKDKNGKNAIFKARLCNEHTKEILKIGPITSIVYGKQNYF